MSLLAAALLVSGAAPQETPSAPPPEPAAPAWEVGFETWGTDPPGDDAYVYALLQADRGPLHLEARWGYEDHDTLSLWVGRNYDWRAEVSGRATPMLGLLVGDTDGVAPGFELALDWRALWLTSQSEYVFDLGGDSDDFFYTWNELGLTLFERLDVGLAAQRTRLFDQELEVDRGVFVGWSGERIALSLYLFNPEQDDPYLAFGFNFGF